jgi:nucleoside-diphosphate-sugar epimerase
MATIVVVGVTGQVALPLAASLTRDHEVVGAARFSNPDARRRLEAAGVHCVEVDLAEGRVDGLPADADYVLNFAVAKSNRWGRDLDANVGGVLTLMEHHRGARAFLHCSSTAVYRSAGHHTLAEDAALGDSHEVWRFLSTYSISKIGAEAAARWAARRFSLPTTIARLSVPYGDAGGWPAIHLEMVLSGSAIPVHVDAPTVYNPIHDDDIVRMVPLLLDVASVPATVVNWGGDQVVSIEEWCGYLAELTGRTATFEATDRTLPSVPVDTTRMRELVGGTEVDWRDGMRRMVAARHPEALVG